MATIERAVSPAADVREILETVAARCAMHESEERLDPEAPKATMQILEGQCHPAPQHIILVDDVITTGCSFSACSALLQQRFPGLGILGISRRGGRWTALAACQCSITCESVMYLTPKRKGFNGGPSDPRL